MDDLILRESFIIRWSGVLLPLVTKRLNTKLKITKLKRPVTNRKITKLKLAVFVHGPVTRFINSIQEGSEYWDKYLQ